MAEIEIKVMEGALVLEPRQVQGAGAVARFEGVVRGEEDGRTIGALEYEAYTPMAQQVMQEILLDLQKQYPFALARVYHRTGCVPVGAAAIILEVHASHRAEAFAVSSAFMDRLKQDVPIWKVRALDCVPAEVAPTSRGGLMPIETLWEKIDALVSPLEGEESLGLERALGRLLAGEARAAVDWPPFDQSAVDGFAFAEGLPGRCRLVGVAAAGSQQVLEVTPGHAVRILTGAQVPLGTFAIAMQEDCHVDGASVEYTVTPLAEGAFIRRQAGVFRKGLPILHPGIPVTPGLIALAASAGIPNLTVSRKPRAMHIVTGDELTRVGFPLSAGQIYDSNGPMMAALLAQAGALVSGCHLADETDALTRAVAGFDGDLLLISGGSGPGDHDGTTQALVDADYTLHASRINSRPGKPLIFATRGKQVAFGLPGNPLSHFVCYHAFVRRALCKLSRLSAPELEPVRLRGSLQMSGGDGRRSWTPAVLVRAAGGMEAMPLPWKHSGDLTPLAKAEALILGTEDARTGLAQALIL